MTGLAPPWFGSFAPTQIFVEAFHQAFDVDITTAEARVPMGLGKWQHIEALGKLPSVDARWQAKFGRAMTAADIDAIYAAFMPLQIAKVVDFSAPIAGVVETISALRAEGLKVVPVQATRPVMKLVPAAAAGAMHRTTGSPPTTSRPAAVQARGWRCKTSLLWVLMPSLTV